MSQRKINKNSLFTYLLELRPSLKPMLKLVEVMMNRFDGVFKKKNGNHSKQKYSTEIQKFHTTDIYWIFKKKMGFFSEKIAVYFSN